MRVPSDPTQARVRTSLRAPGTSIMCSILPTMARMAPHAESKACPTASSFIADAAAAPHAA